MYRCRCGYETSSKSMMKHHVNLIHRKEAFHTTSVPITNECNCFNNSALASFLVLDSSPSESSKDDFSGGGGTFGGGGASGSWDSDSSSSSSSCESSSDCGSSGND